MAEIAVKFNDNAIREMAEVISGLTCELEHEREAHRLTLERKSALMQDWLADQRTKCLLREQVRGLGDEPCS